MHFNIKLILTLLLTISKIFAAINDKCTGRNGICLQTDTCSQYGGQIFTGKCPDDPSDVRCVIIFLAKLMMEEQGNAYLLVNVMVI